MICYQLDECADFKRLAERCAAEGLVDLRRCPKKLKRKEDPEVLDAILGSNSTLLTTDRTIHCEHNRHIPDAHPGILIIASLAPWTLRARDVERILRQFKSAFPNWHTITIRNSVVEITERYAEIWKVVGGTVVRFGRVEFTKDGWQDELRKLLSQNAKGQQTIGG